MAGSTLCDHLVDEGLQIKKRAWQRAILQLLFIHSGIVIVGTEAPSGSVKKGTWLLRRVDTRSFT
jgi:hypothetical protein